MSEASELTELDLEREKEIKRLRRIGIMFERVGEVEMGYWPKRSLARAFLDGLASGLGACLGIAIFVIAIKTVLILSGLGPLGTVMR